MQHKFKSRRRKPLIEYEGHLFYKNRDNDRNNNVHYWVCIFKDTNYPCRATLKTDSMLRLLKKNSSEPVTEPLNIKHICLEYKDPTLALQKHLFENYLVDLVLDKSIKAAFSWDKAQKYASINSSDGYEILKCKIENAVRRFTALSNKFV